MKNSIFNTGLRSVYKIFICDTLTDAFQLLLMIANMEPNDDRLMEPPWDRANGAR